VKKITSPDNNKIAIMTLPGTVWQEPCTMDQPRKEIISWREVSKLVSIIIPQFESVFDSIIMISPSGVIPAGMLAAAAGIGELMIAQVDFPPDTDLEKSKLLSWPNFTHFPPHEMLLEKLGIRPNNLVSL
jgi:hypothetical protein